MFDGDARAVRRRGGRLSPSLRGVFVTGTDTGVGKTVVAGAIAAALREQGRRVAAFKPVVTGLDEPAAPAWPRDHELLAAAAGTRVERRHAAPLRAARSRRTSPRSSRA